MVLPGSLLKALAPRVVSAVSVRAVSAALNHLLAQHPNARNRLAAHQSKKICIGLDTTLPGIVSELVPQPELWFEIDPDGSLQRTEADQAAAKLLVKPSMQAALDVASAGTGELAKHLRVEGDVLLAGLLAELIQGLRWDFEDDLSRVVGDIPARRVGQFAERVGNFGQQIGRRAAAAAGGARSTGESEHQLDNEEGRQAPAQDDLSAPLLGRSVFDRWRNEVGALSRRLDAIESRIRKN